LGYAWNNTEDNAKCPDYLEIYGSTYFKRLMEEAYSKDYYLDINPFTGSQERVTSHLKGGFFHVDRVPAGNKMV